MATVRAIDVGFGQTKFVMRSESGRIDCGNFPSLAFPVLGRAGLDDLERRRNTMLVPVDGFDYEVGPEVALATRDYKPRLLHDGYAGTAEYRALMFGALSSMKLDHIDLLVLGLPVSRLGDGREVLAKGMTGTFDLAGGRRVKIDQVLVLAQPQGAMVTYMQGSERSRAVLKQKAIVIDVGSRTLDWIVVDEMRVVGRLSGSINRGVTYVLRDLADMVGARMKTTFDDLEGIDECLRQGKALRVQGRTIQLDELRRAAETMTMPAIGEVLGRIEAATAYDNVVLVGGGAGLFRSAVRTVFGKVPVQEPKDAHLANVRGFQLLGERVIRERSGVDSGTASAAARP